MCARVCLKQVWQMLRVNLGEADMGFLAIGFEILLQGKVIRKGLRGTVEVGEVCVGV